MRNCAILWSSIGRYIVPLRPIENQTDASSLGAFPARFLTFRTANPPAHSPAHEFALLIFLLFPQAAWRQRHILLREHAHEAIGGAIGQAPLLTILDVLVDQDSDL